MQQILSTYEHPGDDDELMMAVVLVHRLVTVPMVNNIMCFLLCSRVQTDNRDLLGAQLKFEVFQVFLQKLISRFHVVVNISRSREEGSPEKTWEDENDNNEVLSSSRIPNTLGCKQMKLQD